MGCCCAVGCSNRNTKGFRLFKLPKEKNRRLLWIRNIRRSKWIPTDRSELCEAHFEPSQFEQGRQDGWKKLKANAIPTIFAYNQEERKEPQIEPPKDEEISPEQLYDSEPPEEDPSTSHVSLQQDNPHVTPSVLQPYIILVHELDVKVEADQSGDHACPNSSTTEKSASSPTSNASDRTADTNILNTRQYQSSSANEALSKESLEDYGSSELHTSVKTLACAFPDQRSSSTDRLSASETEANNITIKEEGAVTGVNDSSFTETAGNLNEVLGTEFNASTDPTNRLSASETEANNITIKEEGAVTDVNDSSFTETAGNLNEVLRTEVNASTGPTNDSQMPQELYSKLLQRIQHLEQRNNILRCRESSTKRKYERLQTGLKKIFNDDQIQALSRESNRGCKWSEQTIKESLELYFACGTTGYDLLCSKSLPLPSARSLRERIQGQQRTKKAKLHHCNCSSFHG
ncbi:THAP domain-containing protein 5 [Rhipicephalus sanguineus]|uniref:THAP domain-containing protein 5 n=1 Tax=Rhipicephalus sanguineus TaxID=34632 RepID=UPI0018958590|nr:THAP domain-containing protein 5 [Rhipicephalus sanguineus]